MEFSKMLHWIYGKFTPLAILSIKKKMTDIPNEHHNSFKLNQIHDMYMASSLKSTDRIFELLPNLFVDRILKKWMNAHIQIVAQL